MNAKVTVTSDAVGNWIASVKVPIDRECYMEYELQAPSQNMMVQLIVAVLFKKWKGNE